MITEDLRFKKGSAEEFPERAWVNVTICACRGRADIARGARQAGEAQLVARRVTAPSHGPSLRCCAAVSVPEVASSTSPAAGGRLAGRPEKFAATTSEPTRYAHCPSRAGRCSKSVFGSMPPLSSRSEEHTSE